MASGKNYLKYGTVEMVVLFLLDKGDLYGYQLSSYLDTMSEGDFTVNESTLYPTLYRMIDSGYITDRIETVGRRRTRVYYSITEKGKERLSLILAEYTRTTAGIQKILSCDTLPEEKQKNDENHKATK